MLGGWGLTFLALLNLRNYHLVLPPHFPTLPIPFWPVLLAGFVLMVLGLRRISVDLPLPDLSPWTARIGFVLLFVLAAAFRLFDADRAPGLLADDHFIFCQQVRGILDFGQHPFLFSYNWTEPLFNYAAALVWWLMPKATGMLVLRITSALFDLGTVIVFYFLGKEAGGRRMGLILMAMGAVSKGLIEISDYSQRCHLVILACALTLLFLFRVFRRPVLSNFMGLALALGFGGYTYPAFRPWVPAVVAGLMVWILCQAEGKPKTRWGWVLAASFAGAWCALFAFQNVPAMAHLALARFFFASWGGILILIVLVFSFFKVWREDQGLVFQWVLAGLVAALIYFPLWIDPYYSAHTNQEVILNARHQLSPLTALKQTFENFCSAFQLLFSWNSPNYSNDPHHPIQDDSYLDFYLSVFGILGLACLWVRMNWEKVTILVLFVVGLLPFMMTPWPSAPRTLACLAPIFLTAAWGADRLWRVFALAFKRIGKPVGTVLLLGFGAWALYSTLHLTELWRQQRVIDAMSADVIKNELSNDRVYLLREQDYFVGFPQNVLCDGKDVHLGMASNPIDLAAGEKGKDLAVMMYVNDPNAERLRKEFPRAVWKEMKSYQGYVELRWMVVPFAELSESPDKMFYIRRVPRDTWRREFFTDYGLARGLNLLEDRVVHWDDPAENLPAGWGGFFTERVSGRWTVPNPGRYLIKLHTLNTTRVLIDGRLVVQMAPGEKDIDQTAEVGLPAGPHTVEALSALAAENHMPAVLVHSVSEGWEKPMDMIPGADGTSTP